MSIHNSLLSHSQKTIIKSASIIAFATFCSRILGFARDAIVARMFGVYIYAQAFVIAFKIPNLFRDLVGEGASNSCVVPVFSEYIVRHKKEEFWELVNIILNLLIIALIIITLFGILFAPFIVRLIAPGFLNDAEKLKTTVLLTRILFPYIILISLASFATATLNSLKHFSLPAFAPCFLNISIIIFALIFGEGIKGLSLGVLIGGILQLMIQVPILYRKGFRPVYFLKRFSHPAVKSIKKLMLPRLFSSGVYQVNNFVDSIFGSLSLVVGEGAIAGLYFAYRLIQFPMGIFSNALSQAILPVFSVEALDENKDKLKQTLSFGLRANFFVMLPVTAAFMILAKPFISTLFGGGKFDNYSIEITANVLFFYSLGLFAYGAVKILQSCFFALKDTLIPAKVSFLALIMNIILNAIFMFPLKLSGLALATSLSGINTFFVLLFILRKRLAPFDCRLLIFSFIRILLASLSMGIFCLFFSKNNLLNGLGAFIKFINLFLTLFCSLLFYIVFCFIFRVKEMQEVYLWVMRKVLR